MTGPTRCPLCNIQPANGVIEHLEHDHRRTDDEARALLERSMEGTLGWDPETRKRKNLLSARAFRRFQPRD